MNEKSLYRVLIRLAIYIFSFAMLFVRMKFPDDIPTAFAQMPSLESISIQQELSQFASAGLDRFYSPPRSLSINPIISWNTFLGSPSADLGNAITVDGNGNIYVTGWSENTWGNPINPFKKKAADGNYSTGSAFTGNAFVAKLNPNGLLEWNTYLGTSGSNIGEAIMLDGDGNVYVAGTSDATWGNPVNPFNTGLNIDGNPSSDAFVAKLNNNGVLQWNTFMGSSNDDTGNDISVDGGGNIYIAGTSTAITFMTDDNGDTYVMDMDVTWGKPLNSFAGYIDVFAAKLNSSGALVWNTFMGSSYEDVTTAIDVDNEGNVYVGGYSDANWGNPVKDYPYQETLNTNFDAFIAKLNSDGTLEWNTFLGAAYEYSDKGSKRISYAGYCSDIAVYEDGSVFLTGWGHSAWGNPINGFNIGTNSDGYLTSDAFVAKLNSNGDLQWNTFMGSSDDDEGNSIALDSRGNIYLTGYSSTKWGSPIATIPGLGDGFTAKLSSNGILEWNTFMGSRGRAIAVDENGNVSVTGISDANWGNPINVHAGDLDAFVTRLNLEDATHPTLVRFSPEESATGISIDTTVSFTFSESINVSTLNNSTFSLNDGRVSGTISYDPDTYTATFIPDKNLKYDHQYTVTLTTGILDESGNSLAGTYSWNFTTTHLQDEPEDRATLILEAIDNYYHQFTLPDNFPKSVIQAIVAQETGRYHDFNNEIVAEDWGRGVMQITTNGFVGAGSGGCIAAECIQCKDRQNRDACQAYYSNTQEGINRNVRDGLYALEEKYRISGYCGNVQAHLDISPEEICWLSIAQRYNTGGEIPTEYLWRVGERLQKLKYNWYDIEGVEDQSTLGEKFQRAYIESAKLESPGILRVYNSQGQATGIVNGEVREEIPNSIYDEDEEIAIILFPTNSYRYQVIGLEDGNYGLTINYTQDNETTTFRAVDISITTNAIHQYTVDWKSLAEGEKGIAVQIDSDGDGIFEETINTSEYLSEDEFQSQRLFSLLKANSILLLSIIIFFIVIFVMSALMVKALRKLNGRNGTSRL
ncbi:MAG: SBBP repeat-containing protein [Anaerolineales bacterium]|nr:SBBP repeat-containing protein [Anaerolineales bacterium]